MIYGEHLTKNYEAKSMTLVITVADTRVGDIGCSFEEGIGLYELFQYDKQEGKQFVVSSLLNDDLTEEAPSNGLISSFSSEPHKYKYIFR